MLIDQETRALLERKYSEELVEDVDIKVFTREIIVSGDDPEYARFSKDLVKELSQINKKIKAEYVSLGDELAKELELSFSPTIVLGYNSGYSIQYWGVPAGQIASTLVEAVSLVSQKKSGLDQSIKEKIEHIDKKSLIETYYALDSPASSQAVLLSHRIAIERPGQIISRAVEVEEAIKKAKISEIPNLPFVSVNGSRDSVLSGPVSAEKLVYQLIVHGSSNKETILAQMEEEEENAYG